MTAVDRLAAIAELYRTHAAALRSVIEAQRAFLAANTKTVTPQLDDIEAEVTYLLLRHHRPEHVVEIGTFYGWSTTWILRALADNGAGHLHSFDMVDHVRRTVPAELAGDRWTFHQGDVKDHLDVLPSRTDYLFIDADHGRRFGRWYVEHLFPRMAPGTPTSVHDVFHGRSARVWSEGKVVVGWLDDRAAGYFTAARRHAPRVFAELNTLREDLGILGARGTTKNPMIWFDLP